VHILDEFGLEVLNARNPDRMLEKSLGASVRPSLGHVSLR
jgi:hypothetical protein